MAAASSSSDAALHNVMVMHDHYCKAQQAYGSLISGPPGCWFMQHETLIEVRCCSAHQHHKELCRGKVFWQIGCATLATKSFGRPGKCISASPRVGLTLQNGEKSFTWNHNRIERITGNMHRVKLLKDNNPTKPSQKAANLLKICSKRAPRHGCRSV